ncbi:Zinc-binding [Carex littledalei]|uniref:Zinc-binding n=1 Tax=Carex littledalei TaxID=544730 RepID=A0A833QJD9_9POAL|nr:Zinc-binding [Carex littledalei]
MGGGNAQKSKTAREKNLEKNKAPKGSQLDSNKKAMNIQCKVCMQTFICTTSEVKCQEHAEAKHPKADLYHVLTYSKLVRSFSGTVNFERLLYSIVTSDGPKGSKWTSKN